MVVYGIFQITQYGKLEVCKFRSYNKASCYLNKCKGRGDGVFILEEVEMPEFLINKSRFIC